MDLYGELHAMNHTPERVAARRSRRAARRDVFSFVGEAVGHNAQMDWALEHRDRTGTPVGHQHPGLAAILAVRTAVAAFDLPGDFRTRYVGMKRFSGRGGHGITDGIINIELSFRSMTGVDRTVDIPVMVHEGRVLEPAVLVDQGEMRAIAKSTFDDLVSRGTFYAPVPARPTMYSPPPEARRPVKNNPIVRPGMFGTAPLNRALTAAYVRSAVRGQYVGPLLDFETARAAAAVVAEDARTRAPAWDGEPEAAWVGAAAPTDDVRLAHAVDVVDRGGGRWHLAKGTRGRIEHDIFGDGKAFYVAFPGIGTFSVDDDALTRS